MYIRYTLLWHTYKECSILTHHVCTSVHNAESFPAGEVTGMYVDEKACTPAPLTVFLFALHTRAGR